jgi:hypothetical protein
MLDSTAAGSDVRLNIGSPASVAYIGFLNNPDGQGAITENVVLK